MVTRPVYRKKTSNRHGAAKARACPCPWEMRAGPNTSLTFRCLTFPRVWEPLRLGVVDPRQIKDEPLPMTDLSPKGARAVEEIANRTGFSADAVTSMLLSVVAGHGRMAQFSHPEFGGSGQWMGGGAIMISDMFNNALKARVDALCVELAELIRSEPDFAATGSFQSQSQGSRASVGGASSSFLAEARDRANWWPADPGHPRCTAPKPVRHRLPAKAYWDKDFRSLLLGLWHSLRRTTWMAGSSQDKPGHDVFTGAAGSPRIEKSPPQTTPRRSATPSTSRRSGLARSWRPRPTRTAADERNRSRKSAA